MQLHSCSLSCVPVVCECWHRSVVSWSKVQQFDPVEKMVSVTHPDFKLLLLLRSLETSCCSSHAALPSLTTFICWSEADAPKWLLMLLWNRVKMHVFVFVFAYWIFRIWMIMFTHLLPRFCQGEQRLRSEHCIGPSHPLLRWHRKCTHLHYDSLLLSEVTPASHYDSLTGSLWLKDLSHLTPAAWLPQARELTNMTWAHTQTSSMHLRNTLFAI